MFSCSTRLAAASFSASRMSFGGGIGGELPGEDEDCMRLGEVLDFVRTLALFAGAPEANARLKRSAACGDGLRSRIGLILAPMRVFPSTLVNLLLEELADVSRVSADSEI